MNICFIDETSFCYDANSLYSKELRGAESVIINLSNALASLGIKVTVINNCLKSTLINGVNWIDIKSIKKISEYDLVISNGDCRLFKYTKSKKNILFSHSLQNIEKFIRKKQLISYLKYKPKVCFLSNYHKKNRSKLLYLFGEINLKWAVDKIFLDSTISENINNEIAVFTSRPDRNLKMLIDIWTRLVIPNNKKLQLLVTENNYEYFDKSIVSRVLGDQRALIKDLQSARMLIIPGHKAELYCLAAEEARELCIPIVTMGIGSLSERVIHGKTGFIAKNEHDFASYILKLFSDDSIWKLQREYLKKNRKINTWKKVAEELVRQNF
tara:strand:+ start:1062 stop:2039 length:978 start_codon:yes stop_codon:yes gene_type:complete